MNRGEAIVHTPFHPPVTIPPVVNPPVANPTAQTNVSASSTPSCMHDVNTISKFINENPTLRPKFSTLLRHGFLGNIEQVVEQVTSRLDSNAAELKKQGHLVWEMLSNELPMNFFTECCMFSTGNYIHCLGPQDDKNLIMIKIEIIRYSKEPKIPEFEDEAWDSEESEKCGVKSIIKISGNPPPAVVLFRKMPLYFLKDGKLYLGYIDTQPINGRGGEHPRDTNVTAFEELFKFVALDLETWEMQPINIRGGEHPRVTHAMAFEGCFLDNKVYLVSNQSTLNILNLETLVWSRMPLTGSGPSALTGSSNYCNGEILVFGNQEGVLHTLNLVTRTWSSVQMKNSPKISLRDCHLMRPLGTSLVLVRMSDNSEIWFFDLKTFSWEKKDSFGLRPGDYSTNPTYIIEGGILYLLGGQSVKKHLLFQGTNPPRAAVPIRAQAPQNRDLEEVGDQPAAALAPMTPDAAPIPVVAPVPPNQAVPAPIPAIAPAPAPTPAPIPTVAAQGNPMPQVSQLMIQSERKNMFMRIVLEKKKQVNEAEILSRRLSKMYDNPFKDVTFIFPDGTKLQAHRTTLSSNSRFSKLFLADPSKTEFFIENWDSKTFSAFIFHFYEKLELSTVEPFALYRLAEEFHEGSLKVKILKYLSSKNDAATLLAMYQLSSKLDPTPCNNRLKRKAEEDLSQEFSKISKSKEFRDFMKSSPELLPPLFSILGERKSCY